MKTKLATILVAVLATLLLSFANLASAAPGAKPLPSAKSAPVAAVQPAAAPAPAATPVPPHPEIREALDSLRRARRHVAEAKHDFGGHRAEALRATDAAINQLEICLKYD